MGKSIEELKAEYERKQKIHSESVDRFVRKTIKKIGQDLYEERKKMGRPPIPDEKKREKNKVSVYLNEEELDAVKEMASNAGTSVSEYIRTKLLGK